MTRAGTLYFSSNREGSLGQNDVYRARRVAGAWTAPENLGPPVNTSGRRGGSDDLYWVDAAVIARVRGRQ